MRNVLKLLLPLLALVLALAVVFRENLVAFVHSKLTEDMFVQGDFDDFDPGPAVGSHFPGLRATYRGHAVTLVETFAGRNGTVLIASRSFDWCPYCRRQLIQLQETLPDFQAAGIGLVAMSYDAPGLQRAFVERHGITIPVLSDTDALSFTTLGILNRDYEPGDARFGIPHPGAIVIDPDGKVVGKLFLQDYSSRVDSSAILAFARDALGID
jgi:peroxiredoxin